MKLITFLKRILGIPSGLMLRVGLMRARTFRTVNAGKVMLLRLLLVIEAKYGVQLVIIRMYKSKVFNESL